MENRFLLQRQYHPLTVTCTAGSKYILGRDIRRGQILDPSTTFIRCCSEFVSRKHSEISCDSHGVWKVRDLGSMNGTFHQSSRLALDQVRELRHGDIIGLGIGDDGPIEGIDIRDEKYFIFKFVEVRTPSRYHRAGADQRVIMHGVHAHNIRMIHQYHRNIGRQGRLSRLQRRLVRFNLSVARFRSAVNDYRNTLGSRLALLQSVDNHDRLQRQSPEPVLSHSVMESNSPPNSP